MEFAKSEAYRKYLIKIDLLDVLGYAIWGTDMEDEERDKLLVKDNKLLLFPSTNGLKSHLENIAHPYNDALNFSRWVEEEDLSDTYTEYDFSVVANYHHSILSDKEKSLEVLSCIHLMEDFCLQIETSIVRTLFENDDLVNLKEYIYDHFFWTPDPDDKTILPDEKVSYILKDIFSVFLEHVEMMPSDFDGQN